MLQTTGPGARDTITIREATDADAPQIVDLAHVAFDWTETVEEFRAEHARMLAGGYASLLTVAEALSGQIVGYAHVHHRPNQFHPAQYHLLLATDPGWRGQGIGSALYARAMEVLRARGGQVLESSARESTPASVAFLVRRGFREAMRTWEYWLDVRRFDAVPFARYQQRARDEGVTIITLDEERRRDPRALRRAYDLHTAVSADVPQSGPFTPVAYEEYLRRLEAPEMLLDAYFLACAGGEYVGEANLLARGGGAELHHGSTGVLRAYRRRGIAMALKLASIQYAQAHVYPQIKTWNESGNRGMIAINERLGFVRQPAWITFRKPLGGAEGEAAVPDAAGGVGHV